MTAPRSGRRTWLRGLLAAAALAMAALAAAGCWGYRRLRASLPQLDGTAALRGLAAPVRIDRDALGVPTVRGASRLDVARATGYVHAQDRFFQMDLLRRRGAGELAELVGAVALPLDRATRVHGFRKLAKQALQQASPEGRRLLESYAEGVNAGLAALGSQPFEYTLLRTEPKPWLPEDFFLVHDAMVLDLQDQTGRFEHTLLALRDGLGVHALAFFSPLVGPSDAALDGSATPLPSIPGPAEIDLRRAAASDTASAHSPGLRAAAVGRNAPLVAAVDVSDSDTNFPGSNAFAVSGAHTASGAALVAGDMHLHLSVPNIWYRISLEWPGHKVTGVSLPGIPAVVAGSNGSVAWSFTNSNADTGDLIVVDPSISPDLYHAPGKENLVPFENRSETILVRGQKPVVAEYRWTTWGPIVGEMAGGKLLAFRWTEDEPGAVNLGFFELEEVRTAAEAVEAAHHMGIPAGNLIAGDASGAIAWTVAGKLPKRYGYDGRLPVSGAFGDRRWDGLQPAAAIPAIVAPSSGILWSANSRPIGGPGLAVLGDSGYDRGARASQIRDRLQALIQLGRPAEPKDLLAIQLDDTAVFLTRWQRLLVESLSSAAAKNPARERLREIAEHWEGRADVSTIGYALVRTFRAQVAHRVLDPIFARCREIWTGFDIGKLRYEDALWSLISARPLHLLDPRYASWDALLGEAADGAALSLTQQGLQPDTPWGLRNAARIKHPLATALPGFLAAYLNMPRDPLPGDSDMPRVLAPDFGASERFVVSPGHESQGILHMPGGASGHPLSPYYRAGHEAWVRGEATPFLPGAVEHSLVLQP